MPECDECGREFDTERGLHVHQAQKHGDAGGGQASRSRRDYDVWKLATVVFAGLFVLSVAGTVFMDDTLSRDAATTKAMNYLHEEIKGGENATLVSTSDTNSSVYRARIRTSGTVINMYVTKDGEYLFFNSAKMD